MTKHNASKEPAHGTLRSYSIGFGLSIILTLIPYYLIVNNSFSTKALFAVIMAFAVIQLLVQLLFFLHLGQEPKPRWNLIVFLFMLIVLVILVFGTLWIMNNLDYNMSHQNIDEYIQEEEAIYKSESGHSH